MDLIKKGFLNLIGEKCYDNYFLEHNFLDANCFTILLSKGLGLAIIAGSLLVKVPQVVKIFKSKSAEGINLVGVLLDLLAITFHMSYSYRNGYPFTAWGDNTFLALQTAAIAALVLNYSGAKAKSIMFCAAYASFVYILNTNITPMKVLIAAQSCNIPILLVGKLTQAWTNYKNGSTGQLSAVTVILLFAGSLARIFTSFKETGDSMMIITFCASSFANGVIASQLFYYWDKTGSKSQKVRKPAVSKKPKSKKTD